MIERAEFGRTGHTSSRIIFGAAALGNVSQADADRTLELISDAGVNHIDTAASYGESELRLGPWLEVHRDEVFLATKTGEREAGPAYDQIRASLERLPSMGWAPHRESGLRNEGRANSGRGRWRTRHHRSGDRSARVARREPRSTAVHLGSSRFMARRRSVALSMASHIRCGEPQSLQTQDATNPSHRADARIHP